MKDILHEIDLAGEPFRVGYRLCLRDPSAKKAEWLQNLLVAYRKRLHNLQSQYAARPGQPWKVGWPIPSEVKRFTEHQAAVAYQATQIILSRRKYLAETFDFLTRDEDGAALAMNATARLAEDLDAGRGLIADAMRAETLAQHQTVGGAQ